MGRADQEQDRTCTARPDRRGAGRLHGAFYLVARAACQSFSPMRGRRGGLGGSDGEVVHTSGVAPGRGGAPDRWASALRLGMRPSEVLTSCLAARTSTFGGKAMGVDVGG